tara:strand:- start:561 stop:2039 length:1479 start_codon:yes stop_codon:yes gene_type:complete
MEVDNCRLLGLKVEPFIASPAMEMKTYICYSAQGREVATCAVSGHRLYINPDFWESHIKAVRVTMFMHEAWHVALMHHLRRGSRHHYYWNIACDFLINLILVDAGFDPIPGWFYDRQYAGWSEERIYDDVIERVDDFPPPPIDRSKTTQPDSNDDGGDSDSEDDDSKENEENEDGTSSGSDEPQQDAENGSDDNADDGSSGDADDADDADDSNSDGDVDGRGEEPDEKDGEGDIKAEHKEPGQMPIGEVWDAEDEDGKQLNNQEKKQEVKRLKEDLNMSRNMNRQKKSGDSDSQSAYRTVDRLLTPQSDWSSQLEKFFSSAGMPSGYAWNSLDRRGLQIGLYQPAEIKHSIGWMVFLWDVSISMDWRAHRALYSNVDLIRETTQIDRITMLPFNSRALVHEIVELTPDDPLPTGFRIGGGTDFASPFKWVADQKETPDGIMVFTDLGDENYGPEPDAPVVWVSSDPLVELRNFSNRPPWGEVIEIDLSSEGN